MCQHGANNPCRLSLGCVLGYWWSLDKDYTEKGSKSVKKVKRILVTSLLVWAWCFGNDQTWTSLKICGKVSGCWKILPDHLSWILGSWGSKVKNFMQKYLLWTVIRIWTRQTGFASWFSPNFLHGAFCISQFSPEVHIKILVPHQQVRASCSLPTRLDYRESLRIQFLLRDH
jgi:hypothetical protein